MLSRNKVNVAVQQYQDIKQQAKQIVEEHAHQYCKQLAEKWNARPWWVVFFRILFKWRKTYKPLDKKVKSRALETFVRRLDNHATEHEQTVIQVLNHRGYYPNGGPPSLYNFMVPDRLLDQAFAHCKALTLHGNNTDIVYINGPCALFVSEANRITSEIEQHKEEQ